MNFIELQTFFNFFVFFNVDINECGGTNDCHANATCNNTIGCYTCTCDTGFTGDGENCTGEKVFQ